MKKLILLFCVMGNSYAFNWDKCTKKYKNPILGLPISTTSFISSTGDCAMIGMVQHDRKVFLAQNLENIQTDSARGDGEYITAYASLSGCNETGSKALPGLFQKNFIQIYGERVEKKPKSIYESMELIIQSDPVTSKNCIIRSAI